MTNTPSAVSHKITTSDDDLKKQFYFPKKKFIAGSCAGIADIWLCHPLDRIKTHLQQHPKLGILNSTHSIFKKGGIRALYEGIWPMTVEAIVKVGLRFFTFNFFSDNWRYYIKRTKDPQVSIGVAGNLFAGAMAGAVESIIIVIPCNYY